MESFKIIQEKENTLFNRKEIEFQIYSDATPKKPEIENFVSEKFSSPKENIKVKKIIGSFGSRKFNVSINIYKTKEDREKTEFKSKKEKEAESKLLEEQKKGGEKIE